MARPLKTEVLSYVQLYFDKVLSPLSSAFLLAPTVAAKKALLEITDVVIADGDKGDITVSGSGATWVVDNGVITLTKLDAAVTAVALGGQAALVSATNIKTINGSSILGSGNLVVSGFSSIQAIVDLPYPAKRSHKVTVVDVNVSGTSKLMVSLAGVSETQANASDSVEMIGIQAVPGAGSFEFQVNSMTPVAGPLTINYAIG